MTHLLVFGAGYSGTAIARAAQARGFGVTLISRTPGPGPIQTAHFQEAGVLIAAADAIVTTAPPGETGDPILTHWAGEIGRSHAHLLYLSTTGVYGDRGGNWVDETTEPAPGQARSRRRLAAEKAWRAIAGTRPLDLARLAGIYGPGRSAFDDLRTGRARRILHPGHLFGRIHRDDIASGILAAIARPPAGTRILHFTDDLPAASADVIEEAARLLGAPLPPAIPFEEAWASMSDMARSFWVENRKVANASTHDALALAWRYPTYREGLEGILAEESAQSGAEELDILRP